MISHTSPTFFSGLINPFYDLSGKKINIGQKPVAIACNIFTKNNNMHILMSAVGVESQSVYQEFLEQINKLDDTSLKVVLNNILTGSPEGILLPEDFFNTKNDLVKIESARKLSIINLRNQSRAVKFI